MEATKTNNPPRKGMPIVMKFLIGGVILVVLFLIGYVPKVLNSRRLNADAKEEATSAPVVQPISPHLVAPDSVVLPGSVEAFRETSTQARTTGYISKLYVDIGSHVKAGQVLADVESPDVDQQLAQADAQTSQSQATVGQSLANVQSLQASVLGSQSEVQHQRAALVQAKATLAGAKSSKAQAEANLLVARARVTQSTKQVQSQREALKQAQANYSLAAANVKRYSALLEEGYVAQQDYDQSLTTYKTSTEAVVSSRANVESAEADELASEETVHANQQTVLTAQSAEDSALANIKAARSIIDSAIQTLSAAKSNLGAGQQVVHANLAAVQSNVANARRYGVLRSFEHVVAPFDGIITARNVDVGSLVSPGAISSGDATNTTPNTGLFGIARIDTLRIYVNLPQPNFQWAPRGRKVKVMIREMPTLSVEGTINQTSGALDSMTRTLLTEVTIPNPRGILLPGMYAEVEFSPGGEKQIRIPSGAIIVDASGTKVVVIDSSDHIHYKKVVLGRDYGTEAEVVTGLKITDRLAGNATDNWLDGEQVKVVQPGSAKGGASQGTKSTGGGSAQGGSGS